MMPPSARVHANALGAWARRDPGRAAEQTQANIHTDRPEYPIRRHLGFPDPPRGSRSPRSPESRRPRRLGGLARRLRVTTSAGIAVITAAVASIAIAIVIIAITVAPLFSAAIVLVLLLGLLLVRGGVTVAGPVFERVLEAPGRGE
ncbi:MAG: hypothetical protein QM606_04485 [Leucobacter sp.]